MDWHEIEKMKVTELRERVKKETGLEGVSGMSKDRLVAELAKALGVPKPHKVAHGEEKTRIKQQIRALKAARQKAIEAHDKATLAAVRHQIHALKHRLKRHAEMTH